MHNSKFLIVDNSSTNAHILANILKNEGFSDVAVTNTAAKALAILENANVEAANFMVITALVLPEMDGIELCRHIKNTNLWENIPVLMITATESCSTQTEAFDAGMADYIVKPFNPVLVIARIKAAIAFHLQMKACREREQVLARYNRKLLTELQVAQHLQEQILPTTLQTPEISICGCYLPITFLGGDVYYWDTLPDGRIGIVLLDIMGHSTATAMIGMYLRAMLPDILKTAASAADCLQRLNQVMVSFNERMTDIEYNCTASCLFIDTDKQTIEYVRAAAPPAALVEENTPLRWLDEGCLPLGIFAEIQMENQRFAYFGKTLIMLCSDGIYELFMQKQLDENDLQQRLQQHRQLGTSLMEITNRLSALIKTLPRRDDATLICIELFGGKK